MTLNALTKYLYYVPEFHILLFLFSEYQKKHFSLQTKI